MRFGQSGHIEFLVCEEGEVVTR